MAQLKPTLLSQLPITLGHRVEMNPQLHRHAPHRWQRIAGGQRPTDEQDTDLVDDLPDGRNRTREVDSNLHIA